MLPEYSQAEKSQLENTNSFKWHFSLPNAFLFSKVLKQKSYIAVTHLFFFFPKQIYFNGLTAFVANKEVVVLRQGTLLRGKPDTEVLCSHGEELCWWALW